VIFADFFRQIFAGVGIQTFPRAQRFHVHQQKNLLDERNPRRQGLLLFMTKQRVDQLELKQRLLANEISWQDALAIITSSSTPPWKTKEWQVKRDALIANHCKQCGTTEPPLVLQHIWQPKPIAQLFQEMRSNHPAEWDNWKDKHPLTIDLSAIPSDTNACPKCFSPTIRLRKKAKDWKCVAQEAGVFCEHVFETPARVVSQATIKNLRIAAWRKSQEDFDTTHDIGRRVVIAAIDQHMRYLSMQDTITLCKRCAFVADQTKMVLCRICKANYHSVLHDRCSKCAGIQVETSINAFP
jgi:hypothetical protein